jgi:hypothetical protein
MAYLQTSVNSINDLLETIQTFATIHGGWSAINELGYWTGEGKIRGVSLTRPNLTVNLTSVPTGLVISGRNGARQSQILSGIYDESWPAKVYLFSFSNPDFVACIVSSDNDNFRWLAFGNTSKYGLWDGGGWFGASHKYVPANVSPFTGATYITKPGFVKGSFSSTSYVGSGSQSTYTTNVTPYRTGYIKSPGKLLSFTFDWLQTCDLDCSISGGWGANPSSADGWSRYPVADILPYNLYEITPTEGPGVLIPFWLTVGVKVQYSANANNKLKVIGSLPWIRLIRIDSMKPGEVLRRGHDKWIVFPWTRKRALPYDNYYAVDPDTGQEVNPDYTKTSNFSGGAGWAIRYDGV